MKHSEIHRTLTDFPWSKHDDHRKNLEEFNHICVPVMDGWDAASYSLSGL